MWAIGDTDATKAGTPLSQLNHSFGRNICHDDGDDYDDDDDDGGDDDGDDDDAIPPLVNYTVISLSADSGPKLGILFP